MQLWELIGKYAIRKRPTTYLVSPGDLSIEDHSFTNNAIFVEKYERGEYHFKARLDGRTCECRWKKECPFDDENWQECLDSAKHFGVP